MKKIPDGLKDILVGYSDIRKLFKYIHDSNYAPICESISSCDECICSTSYFVDGSRCGLQAPTQIVAVLLKHKLITKATALALTLEGGLV